MGVKWKQIRGRTKGSEVGEGREEGRMAKTEEKAESTGGVASMMLLGGSSRLDENWPGITENQGVWDEKLTGMKEYTSSIPRYERKCTFQ